MLQRISEFEISKMSISNYKDATYLQSDKQPFEIQTEWITGQYPLPSKKYITDESKSLNLTAPTNKDDNILSFEMLSSIADITIKLVSSLFVGAVRFNDFDSSVIYFFDGSGYCPNVIHSVCISKGCLSD